MSNIQSGLTKWEWEFSLYQQLVVFPQFLWEIFDINHYICSRCTAWFDFYISQNDYHKTLNSRHLIKIQEKEKKEYKDKEKKFLWWEVLGFTLLIFFFSGIYLFIYLFFAFLSFSRATPMAHEGSQTRGLMGAVAISLCQSHSNTGSKPHLWPTPHLTAIPDP